MGDNDSHVQLVEMCWDWGLLQFRISFSNCVGSTALHYDDVIMGAMASQTTSLTQSFIQAQIKEKCGEVTGDRWIPRTKGQLRGKCFHLMTSSWIVPYSWQNFKRPRQPKAVLWNWRYLAKPTLKLWLGLLIKSYCFMWKWLLIHTHAPFI